MINKIYFYLFLMKVKYILVTLFLLALFIQIINLIEVSRIVEYQNLNFISILQLSFFKLPTTMLEILPFVIVISTSFFYRYLISNNEFISMRNIGYSILDIFIPVGFAILLIGILFLFFINPLSSVFEKKFENETKREFPITYSIKIKNNEVWIKNIEKNKVNYIKFSNFDLKKMTAKDIKIIDINNDNYKIYIAENGKLLEKILYLEEVYVFDINDEEISNLKRTNFNINFNKKDIMNSITNYRHIPFYKYKRYTNSLKKFNLYSQEVSLFYLSEICKPIFLVILGFIVMGFASKFKRNENFFKIIFFSILIGFMVFIFNELLYALTLASYITFWFAYIILVSVSLIFGLYLSINIEVD